jgi:hypothetical protein
MPEPIRQLLGRGGEEVAEVRKQVGMAAQPDRLLILLTEHRTSPGDRPGRRLVVLCRAD